MVTGLTHLHVHSHYSLGEGVASPAELAQAAQADGLSALALTDHHRLTGAVEFVEACHHAAGVRPILGLALDVAPPAAFWQVGHVLPVVLLATNLSGWASLCQLSTAAQQTENLCVTLEQLAQDAAGLLCLTGGVNSLLTRLVQTHQSQLAGKWLGLLRDIFYDRLYVELQRHSPADESALPELSALARAQAVVTVATHSIYYLRPEQEQTQRLLTAIRRVQPLSTLAGEDVAPPRAHWLSIAELNTQFADYPEAIAATAEIADRCQFQLPLGQPHYPQVVVPAGQTALEVLREKAYAGAQREYGEITTVIHDRLEHELNVIGARGYAPLFLIMEDVLGYARETGVPMSSRGSAASSLVAHCLGLTEIPAWKPPASAVGMLRKGGRREAPNPALKFVTLLCIMTSCRLSLCVLTKVTRPCWSAFAASMAVAEPRQFGWA
jgi:DNA polymerase III alpha subunit